MGPILFMKKIIPKISIIGCGNDGQFRDLCKKLELEHLGLHPKFLTNELRVKHRIELVQIIETQLQLRTNSEWNEILEGAKFPYGPVNPLKDVFQDPQVLHNQMVRTMDHESLGTTIKQVRISFISKILLYIFRKFKNDDFI